MPTLLRLLQPHANASLVHLTLVRRLQCVEPSPIGPPTGSPTSSGRAHGYHALPYCRGLRATRLSPPPPHHACLLHTTFSSAHLSPHSHHAVSCWTPKSPLDPWTHGPLLLCPQRVNLPMESEYWLDNVPLRSASGGLDRCFCRYVTAPLFLRAVPHVAALAAPPSALHLRTGLADVDAHAFDRSTWADGACVAARLETPHLSWASDVESWMRLACPSDAWSHLPTGSYVSSDAPRVLTFLQQRAASAATPHPPESAHADGGFRQGAGEAWSRQQGGAAPRLVISPLLDTAPTAPTEPLAVHAPNGSEPRAHSDTSLQPSKSWEGASVMTLLRLATDAHLIGLATEVYETRRSSFTRPLVARSMCIHRVATLDEYCPSFGDTFVRDLFKFFDGRNRCATTSRYAELRAQLAPEHPCKKLPHARQCREAFVEALL
uniref:Uncharacterized protein n=1 Tax=Haptolina brevifila TaxID=156173 RepID=A0A7S2J697_9EUKA|mmetsp:Transcript_77344/g.153568  ORF Transcript_77344/g.153568 Transcript_77344/m.153568 type:complete len:434 (+) Transcript_77344:842-2143(+)